MGRASRQAGRRKGTQKGDEGREEGISGKEGEGTEAVADLEGPRRLPLPLERQTDAIMVLLISAKF